MAPRRTQRFDQNGDGLISKQELARIFKGLDPDAWTDERIDRLMDAADSDCDDCINYEEFVAWLMGGDREWEADRAAACLKGDRDFHKEGLIVEHRSTKTAAETVFVQVNQEDGVVGKLGIQVADGRRWPYAVNPRICGDVEECLPRARQRR